MKLIPTQWGKSFAVENYEGFCEPSKKYSWKFARNYQYSLFWKIAYRNKNTKPKFYERTIIKSNKLIWLTKKGQLKILSLLQSFHFSKIVIAIKSELFQIENITNVEQKFPNFKYHFKRENISKIHRYFCELIENFRWRGC